MIRKALKTVNIFFLFLTLFLASPVTAVEYLPKNLFVDLGKKINPSVVNIATTQVIAPMPMRRGGPPMMPGPEDPFRQFFEDFLGGQRFRVPEQKVSSLGTGFIIDSTGLIVTNNHVIQNASDIQVQLIEKAKPIKAKVVGQDPRTDIALIKISSDQKLIPVVLGDSDKVEVGEWVAAFGNPFGHGHSMTKGIISAKERDIDIENSYFPFLQTDASINPGNSGGPLVSAAGEVIGVNSAIDARAQGIGFAIPINVVKKLLPELKTKGRITRGYLGVGVNTIDEKAARQLGLKSEKGALVLNVAPRSPAEAAGVQLYDVIVELNGKEIDDAKTLTKVVSDIPLGQQVKLKVLREGRAQILTAKITERPDEQVLAREPRAGPRGLPAPFELGMTLADLTPALLKELDLKTSVRRGVVVTGLAPDGLAAQAGVQVGDVILDINKRAAKSTREALKLFRRGNNVLRIVRDTETLLVFMEVR